MSAQLAWWFTFVGCLVAVFGVAGLAGAWSERLHHEACLLVLIALADGRRLSGAQLSRQAGIGSARLYPALVELAKARKVDSAWEDGPYPRRRLYFIADNQPAATA